MSHRVAAPLRGCVLIVFCLALGRASIVAQAASIGVNFTGVTVADGIKLNNNNGYAPPDNVGGVGPESIVQLINGAFAVYDKSGIQQELISARQFWTEAGIDPGPGIVNLGTFNQRIIYDAPSGHWIAAGLSGEPTNNYVMLARSENSDPLSQWTAVRFLGNAGGDGKFVDYTRLGVDANGVYISTNNYTSNLPGGGLDGVSVFSLPKADLLAATPIVSNLSRFDAIDAGEYGLSIQPIVNFGPSTGHAPILGTSAALGDNVLLRADLTGTGAAGATISPGTMINVAPYIAPPLAAQPDLTRQIQTIDDRISAHAYQIGNIIYAALATKVGLNSGIKWMKIDETTNQVIQEGILSDPNFDYFQPSISANADGDIVISFNRSGFGAGGNLSIFASVGKMMGNLTTFAAPFLLKASTVNNYHYVNNRWGDYTTTVIDPLNPSVFWTFHEYALNNNAWATQITQVIVPEPEGIMLGAMAMLAVSLVAWRRRRRARPA